MRQAICTKYMGPTNTRSGRVKATCDAKSVTVSWDHDLDVAANHEKAAYALCKKLGWEGTLIGGGRANGYCFVFADGQSVAVGKR